MDISKLNPNRPIYLYDLYQKELEEVYNKLSDVLNNRIDLQNIVNKFDKQYSKDLNDVNKNASTDFRMIETFEDYIAVYTQCIPEKTQIEKRLSEIKEFGKNKRVKCVMPRYPERV